MNAQKLYAASASRIATLKFIRIVLNYDRFHSTSSSNSKMHHAALTEVSIEPLPTIINYQCCKSAQYYLMQQANKYQYQQLIPNADI